MLQQIAYIHSKGNSPYTGQHRPFGFQEVEVPRSFKQSTREGGKVVSPTHPVRG